MGPNRIFSWVRELTLRAKNAFPREALLCAGIALLLGLIFSYAIFPYLPGSQEKVYVDRLHHLALNLSSGEGYIVPPGGKGS